MTRTSLIVIACLVGLLGVVGWLLKSQIASNSVLERQLSESQQTLRKYESQQKSVEAVDQHYQQVLNDAKSENDRLNASIAAGRVRLYIPTKCMPPSTSTTSSPNAASRAELDPDTAQNLITITQRGDAAIRQLSGLQEYVRTVCM